MNFKEVIPKEYPQTVDECLAIVAKMIYKSFGFSYIFLSVSGDEKWSLTFRNPEHFLNPSQHYDTPLEACHKMFDFLLTVDTENPIPMTELLQQKPQKT